MLVPAF